MIDENGQQLGIMSSREANALAQERHLDLVEISPQARPPVCKILDYGKYRYEQQKSCAPVLKTMTLALSLKMQPVS